MLGEVLDVHCTNFEAILNIVKLMKTEGLMDYLIVLFFPVGMGTRNWPPNVPDFGPSWLQC